LLLNHFPFATTLKDSIRQFIGSYQVHFLAWALFIAYEILVIGILTGTFGSFLDYAVHYAVNILLFYVFAALVLPWCLQSSKKNRWFLPFLIVLLIFSYVGVIYGLELLLTRHLGVSLTRPLVMDQSYLLRATWRCIYFMGFATGYYFLVTSLRERQRAELAEKQQLHHIIEKQRLEHELVQAQHAFLKAQINPHFLFNTLSFIYNSVRKTSPPAAEAVLSLSEMMRYALQNEDPQQEFWLGEEIEQVEHLIRLHQIRHDYRYYITLNWCQAVAKVKLIPLVLLTLAENMFKHGELNREDSPAVIDIQLKGDVLHITTANRLRTAPLAGCGIGLSNLHLRLHHVYGKKAALQTWVDANHYFNVSLQVAAC
jgi:two-component system, LytTR family, sensor kinase